MVNRVLILSLGLDLKPHTFNLYDGLKKPILSSEARPFRSFPYLLITSVTERSLNFAASSFAHDVFSMNSRELATLE